MKNGIEKIIKKKQVIVLLIVSNVTFCSIFVGLVMFSSISSPIFVSLLFIEFSIAIFTLEYREILCDLLLLVTEWADTTLFLFDWFKEDCPVFLSIPWLNWPALVDDFSFFSLFIHLFLDLYDLCNQSSSCPLNLFSIFLPIKMIKEDLFYLRITCLYVITSSVTLTIIIIFKKLSVMYIEISVTNEDHAIINIDIISTKKKNLKKYPVSAIDLQIMSNPNITIF